MPALLMTVLTSLFVLGCAQPVAAQPAGNRKIRPEPSATTLLAGTEIPWESDLEAALVQAATLGRPVFWYVPTVGGSRMDRKPVLDHYMMAGPFASEEVATLLQRIFVPVKAVATGKRAQELGIVPGTFIEPGFVVLAPDGRAVRRIDRVTTLSAEWFVAVLQAARRDASTASAESDEASSAQKSGSAAAWARTLIEESDGRRALDALGPAQDSEAPAERLLRARALVLLRRSDEARALLEPLVASGSAVLADATFELGRLHGRLGDWATALPLLEQSAKLAGVRMYETQLFRAIALANLGRDDEATQAFADLARTAPRSRHGRKAAAEAQLLGPFLRGFERFEWLPDGAILESPQGTCVPRTEAELAEVRRRAVGLLLLLQRSSGGFDDSNYDFGGTDSLPNVYAATTAIAALALHGHKDLDPEVAGKAVARAVRYLLDDRNLAKDDEDEIAWAHAYRLLLFRRLLADGWPEPGILERKCREIESALIESQGKSGLWRHEYANPFVTATVVHALSLGDPGWKRTPATVVAQARKSLERSRGEDGTFSYGAPRNAGGSAPEFSAGRAPIGELALLLLGASTQERLGSAIALSRAHHHHLEAVRKYDDHADRYGNGGFFFWYALFGRRLAIDAISNADERKKELAALRTLVLGLPEIDGGFVDSHELGRSYGTGMALLCLEGLDAHH